MDQTDVGAATRQDRDRASLTRAQNVVLGIGLVALWLLCWGLSVGSGLADPRVYKSPTDIWDTFSALARSGELWKHSAFSAQRLVIGYVGGMVPAVLLDRILDSRGWLPASMRLIIRAMSWVPAISLLP